MSARSFTYAVVTPARNEAANLRRLAECMLAQTLTPQAWVVVDNGSTDETLETARALAEDHPWIRLLCLPGEAQPRPGAPIVRAFHAGLAALDSAPDIVVKLDADVSFAPGYFERLIGAFQSDPQLGIASGNCYESENGLWHPTHVTGSHVRGASRAYRRLCLDELLPLEERMGWDGIDELKANVRGWTTAIVDDLPFYHHRKVGARDGARHSRWYVQGKGAHYMGYRFWYLVLRALHHGRRRPAAVAMVAGYLVAAVRREPRCSDQAAREHLRRTQRPRELAVRMREALGRR